MMLCMNRFKSLSGNMCINLRRGDIGMTQEQLHHAQIRTVVQKMRSKGMTKGVRR